VPHLLPLKRGILETIYVTGIKESDLVSLYRKFYKKEPFIRVRDAGEYPSLKDVVGTNFSDIGIKPGKQATVIIAAIDNLVKGAAGQAVQNMNIMMGFPETAGL
jgi:N-acetyl-gamma-glutamyl-phosphate reductase